MKWHEAEWPALTQALERIERDEMSIVSDIIAHCGCRTQAEALAQQVRQITEERDAAINRNAILLAQGHQTLIALHDAEQNVLRLTTQVRYLEDQNQRLWWSGGVDSGPMMQS